MQEIRVKIEENKKTLQKLLKNKDNQIILDKWLKTELAYTSNAIEGNTLTRKETELAIEEKKSIDYIGSGIIYVKNMMCIVSYDDTPCFLFIETVRTVSLLATV